MVFIVEGSGTGAACRPMSASIIIDCKSSNDRTFMVPYQFFVY